MSSKVNIKNRKASFEYQFIDKYVAGIMLLGTEIKSIRNNKANISDAHCVFIDNELFVKNRGPSTRSGNMFLRQSANTVYNADNSLRIFGPLVWDNMLPKKLRDCTSLNEFKNSLKSWIPDNCLCGLCKPYIQGLRFVTLQE